MTRTPGHRGFAVLGPFVCLLLWALWTMSPATAQSGSKVGEWRSYGADLANTRYSPLDQINAGNFKNLEVAWRFKTDNLGPRP
jgi:glucose dehydrogenase